MKQKHIKKLINGAINKLDKDDYEILYELYFNNASIHHLSRKLGVTRSSVKWKRNKALKQLKKIIQKPNEKSSKISLEISVKRIK